MKSDWFTPLESSQLRRLVYRAFALRGKPGYLEALEQVETWQVETHPDRLERHAREEQPHADNKKRRRLVTTPAADVAREAQA